MIPSGILGEDQLEQTGLVFPQGFSSWRSPAQLRDGAIVNIKKHCSSVRIEPRLDTDNAVIYYIEYERPCPAARMARSQILLVFLRDGYTGYKQYARLKEGMSDQEKNYWQRLLYAYE
jgi:hypothetical protein